MDINFIKQMGKGFRNLTLHSSGEWSCQLGWNWLGGDNKEFWSNTPEDIYDGKAGDFGEE